MISTDEVQRLQALDRCQYPKILVRGVREIDRWNLLLLDLLQRLNLGSRQDGLCPGDGGVSDGAAARDDFAKASTSEA